MARHPLRVGLKLSPQLFPIATDHAVRHTAADGGFDGSAMPAAMAEATKRVCLGLMVAGNWYRTPGCTRSSARPSTSSRTAGSSSGAALRGTRRSSRSLRGRSGRLASGWVASARACGSSSVSGPNERAKLHGKPCTPTDAIAAPTAVQQPHPPMLDRWLRSAAGTEQRRAARRRLELERRRDGHDDRAPEDPRLPLRDGRPGSVRSGDRCSSGSRPSRNR